MIVKITVFADDQHLSSYISYGVNETEKQVGQAGFEPATNGLAYHS